MTEATPRPFDRLFIAFDEPHILSHGAPSFIIEDGEQHQLIHAVPMPELGAREGYKNLLQKIVETYNRDHLFDELAGALRNLIDDAEHHQDGDDRSLTLDITIERARATLARVAEQEKS